MENYKQIFELLKTIQGNGSFETSGEKKIALPGLNINGVGDVGLPIAATQIKEIIKIAKKAPFGKGSKTVTDTTVRSAWEIDASQLSFLNPDWESFMAKIVKDVKTGLGIEDNAITVSLYKLLIYEEGDFFLPHKDSEKEPGMFGTLIIGLPATHTGGELVIQFDGKEKIIDFSVATSNYKIPYVAFFADCTHQIKPITSGYRVSLVYNLVQLPGSQKLGKLETSSETTLMANILKQLPQNATTKPKAILLEHQYTPANFGLDSLKHNDKPRAQLLLEAANMAGYFAQLGLVTHYKMGDLEGDYDDGYYGHYNYRSTKKNTDSLMGEVYEEYTTIEHWSESTIPPLGNITIENDDIITNYEIGEGIPIEEEEEGYTGNAGMTMEYWYHYGAVILWPKNKHLQLLANTAVEVRLKWLAYYYQNWDSPQLDAIKNGKHIINGFLAESFSHHIDFGIVASFLSKLNDEKFILNNCQEVLIAIFKNIKTTDWGVFLQDFSTILFKPIFEKAGFKSNIYTLNHILEILKILSIVPSQQSDEFLHQQINCIPTYLATVQLSGFNNETKFANTTENETLKNTVNAILNNTIALSKYKQDDDVWINRTLQTLTSFLTRKYVNTALVPAVLNKKEILAQKIQQICVLNLTERTAVMPTPPVNWTREVPNAKNFAAVWGILKSFIESADEQVFEYRKPQSYRTEMEHAIANVTIDFKLETIKKSSPHVLKITKTQAAYQRNLKKWKEDVAILETLG